VDRHSSCSGVHLEERFKGEKCNSFGICRADCTSQLYDARGRKRHAVRPSESALPWTAAENTLLLLCYVFENSNAVSRPDGCPASPQPPEAGSARFRVPAAGSQVAGTERNLQWATSPAAARLIEIEQLPCDLCC